MGGEVNKYHYGKPQHKSYQFSITLETNCHWHPKYGSQYCTIKQYEITRIYGTTSEYTYNDHNKYHTDKPQHKSSQFDITLETNCNGHA